MRPLHAMLSPAIGPEIRANLKLALPLIAAQLAGVGMGATDTIMAGHLGAKSLAAVAVGANVNTIPFVLFMGLFMAASAIVSQRRGAGRSPEEIGSFARSLLRVGLCVAVVWIGVVQLLAAPALGALGLDAETTRLGIAYLRSYAFSGLGLSLWFPLRFVAEGMGCSQPVMRAALTGLGANVLFNWLLIYGVGPFPALGVMGSGIATTIACLVMVVVLLIHYARDPRLATLQLFQPREREQGASAELLRLGLPIGAVLIAEAGLFVVVSVLMARLGERTVAAYQVAINFASVAFMIPVGIASATTVRVGFYQGAGNVAAARFSGLVGMGLGTGNAALNASVMLLLGTVIAGFYTGDTGIVEQAAHFLALAGAFQFFDGLQVTANGALRGLKDTRLPMLITLAAYWLFGLPVAWWLTFHTTLGADGLWWGLTAGLGVAALGLSWRFLRRSRPSRRYSKGF